MSGVLSFACEFRAEAVVTAASHRPLPFDQVPCTEVRNVHLVGKREEKVSVCVGCGPPQLTCSPCVLAVYKVG